MLNALEPLGVIGRALRRCQASLNFENWQAYPQFAGETGLGRVALLSSLLSLFLGFHIFLAIFLCAQSFGFVAVGNHLFEWLGADRLQLLLQWCFYVMSLCIFHLMEFFTTVLFNPSVASADSFLVNHSTTYTFAVLFAWTEFALRFAFIPSWNDVRVAMFGWLVTVMAQVIRSLAMVTCGESFNHHIQRSKKENHVLVTTGIYGIFRHPSYVGFFYWSIGMQLILNNLVAGVLSAVASAIFFRRRIPYEEESLVYHFESEYVEYARRTFIGIPFVPTGTILPDSNDAKDD